MRGITTQLMPQILFQDKSQGKLEANRGGRNKAQTETLASTMAANSKQPNLKPDKSYTRGLFYLRSFYPVDLASNQNYKAY